MSFGKAPEMRVRRAPADACIMRLLTHRGYSQRGTSTGTEDRPSLRHRIFEMASGRLDIPASSEAGRMHAGHPVARAARTRHRYELRTLTYVTLDQANGGIVRNLTHDGIAVQAVAAVRPRQQLRVRFELRYPQLRIEARGEVVWSTFSGQCGIRFLDLSPRMSRQIDEWILGNLLEGTLIYPEKEQSLLSPASARATENQDAAEDDGLMISAAPLRVIELPARPEPGTYGELADEEISTIPSDASELDWLSQPLSGRGLAWTVDTLVVVAALLLSALVFLSVTREAPKWPVTMTTGAAAIVCGLYWGFFKFFGGASPGERLARLAGSEVTGDIPDDDDRFR
jgi:hypothetical protein